MIEELAELHPTIPISDIATIELIFLSVVCLRGTEGRDWIHLPDRGKLFWCLN
jgi:hypothetical protein